MRSSRVKAALAAAATLAIAPAALAHVERPSYWPHPSSEIVEGIPAGGAVPEARTLESALIDTDTSRTFVVCKGDGGSVSLDLLRASIAKARADGYRIRPSQPKETLTQAQADALLSHNEAFAARCQFNSVQAAINTAGNNDRVVVMPGRYTEEISRAAPTNDARCAGMTQLDSGGSVTPSYRYQVECPNDQNLIYVQGRAVPDEAPPSPPLHDRQGIPDAGACVRCNLQVEGTGVLPEDVILDGGKDYVGNPETEAEARPRSYAKHVVLRIDRADGFVAKNLLTRGASEHGIYVEEADGYRLDTVKFFWAADYGNLTFTSDHGLYTNCDGFGAGDAVVYPGASPETGEQVDQNFYTEGERINTTVEKCDMRGSVLAYSGSMGNAVRITNNHIYGNTLGIATDSISASGHPGFPADSSVIDHNYIYSNNLNLYADNPPVRPRVSVPVGVGVIWAGHNNGRVYNNYIFDNWRRGTMLLAIPDAIVTPEGRVNPGVSCPNPFVTTSCGNEYYGNVMGQAPPGFQFPEALDQFGVPHGTVGGPLPNGVDFWWDEFPATVDNCWYDNKGKAGTALSVTSDPIVLPSVCAASVGTGNVYKEAVLVDCNMSVFSDVAPSPLSCDWHNSPPRPGSAAALTQARSEKAAAKAFELSPAGRKLRRQLDAIARAGAARR